MDKKNIDDKTESTRTASPRVSNILKHPLVRSHRLTADDIEKLRTLDFHNSDPKDKDAVEATQVAQRIYQEEYYSLPNVINERIFKKQAKEQLTKEQEKTDQPVSHGHFSDKVKNSRQHSPRKLNG